MTITNILLTLVVLVIAGVLIYYVIKKKKEAPTEQTLNVDDKTYTLEKMQEFVKRRLDEITKVNLYDIGLSEEELKRRKNKKYELKKALKGCTYGDINDKKYVKELIFDLLSKEYDVNESNISKAIPFDVPSLLTAQDKFDILIYMYKKDFGYEALTQMIKKYNLAELKYIEGETKPSYVITTQEIEDIYEEENLQLNFTDKLSVVVQRLYQHYKGYSSIDEVRDMNIDGISGGVSGLPESFLSQVAQTSDADYLTQVTEHKVPRACDSIWIFFQGKSIRLAFLSFGTESELKRVCQNIYKYNNPGQLSDTNGYKINEMKDGSRVVVVRPSFSETWAFFVRKFDVKRSTLEQWFKGEPGCDESIELLKYLVKGARIISITGEQGCGKTTMLMGMIENIYETMNIRVQETAFELHLRKIYPTRNILTFRETDTISGQEGLDVQKKTDGSVNIIGEVATDPVASWMIQALNFDIHLSKDFRGKRFVERITECIPIEEKNEYTFDHRNESTLEGKIDKFFDNATHYFEKITDRKLYEYRNILEYIDGEYIITNPISEDNLRGMRENMDEIDLQDFDKFVNKHWKKNKYDEAILTSSEQIKNKRRGRKPKNDTELI